MFDSKIRKWLKDGFLVFASTTLLFGCAQLPDNSTNVQWQQHQVNLASLEHYNASGKLGFISPDERRSMTFYWRQEGDSTQLRLTSVFGQTLLKLNMTPQQTTIETYEGDYYESTNGEQLLFNLTGLIIPLDQLPHWLKGAINQGDKYTLLPTNTLASQTSKIANRTWQVSYQRYSDIAYNETLLPLPSLLKLTQGDIKINLQISKWTLE